ncbi:MAG: polyprenyl synthetase family protein [Candidatus Hydrothermarchaeales archaeon]
MDRFWQSLGDFRGDMDYINRELANCIPKACPSSLYDASRHLTKTGGKRIRPALVALSFAATVQNGKDIRYVAPIAVAVELIHTATIIHDDIIDKSSMRRGVKTVNAKWGNDTAILAGDLIFSKAFGLVGTHENKDMSRIISRACSKLSEGEVLEALHTSNTQMTEEVYLEVIERKTASLFEAAARCGAILGGASEEEIEALARYGHLLGIGFQMTDDVLDIVAGQKKLGKQIGMDIKSGKVTVPVLHALKNSSKDDRKYLKEIVKKKGHSEKDIEVALKIMKKTKSIDYTLKRARSFVENAKNELRHLNESEAKKALGKIADHTINRQF